MAEEIENEEVDSIEDKAKEIGKQMGVSDDDGLKKMLKADEDAPDYEVVEEKEGENDERIAKEREPKIAKSERKQLTNKEKRELRKKRIHEKFNEKDQIIERQQQQLNTLEGKLSEFEGRLSNVDRAKVDEMLNQAIADFNKAKKDNEDAFREGDGQKHIASLQAWAEANDRIKQLQPLKQKLEQQSHQKPQPQASSISDAMVVNKAKAWAAKHDWYNATNGDEDSEIAKAISGALANEGFDPKTDDFWDELDDRLVKRGIGDREEEEIEDEPIAAAPKRRTAPPVGGGSARSDVKGKKTITLPTGYINTLKANGLWDDIKLRNKLIAGRERIIRESAQ